MVVYKRALLQRAWHAVSITLRYSSLLVVILPPGAISPTAPGASCEIRGPGPERDAKSGRTGKQTASLARSESCPQSRSSPRDTGGTAPAAPAQASMKSFPPVSLSVLPADAAQLPPCARSHFGVSLYGLSWWLSSFSRFPAAPASFPCFWCC